MEKNIKRKPNNHEDGLNASVTSPLSNKNADVNEELLSREKGAESKMSKHTIETKPNLTEKRKSYDDDDEGDDLPISQRLMQFMRKPTPTPIKDGHTRIKQKMTSGKAFTCSKRLELSFEDAWKEMVRVDTSNGKKVQCRHCTVLLQARCSTYHLNRHLNSCSKFQKPMVKDVEIQSTADTAQFTDDEIKEALKRLKDMLSKDFCDILDVRQYSVLKSTIKFLCDTSTNNGISTKVRLSIEQISRMLTQWSQSYTNASRKLDSAKSVISKMDEFEKDLQGNREGSNKVISVEKGLSNPMAKMEKRKKELENELNEINTIMEVFESSKALARNEIKKLSKEENIVKGQRDELKEQHPDLKDQMEDAMKIQENIRAEWYRLGQKFKED